MTREKAITILQREKDCVQQAIQNAVDGDGYVSPDGMIRAEDYVEACVTALTALRPVSREQVEKMWTGCEKCRDQANWPSWIEKGFVYCPKCGTPLTSWAWEKQVERLEALNDAVD